MRKKQTTLTSSLSFVIPLYNEAESIPLLFKEVSAVASSLPSLQEIIVVDDGSTDNSFELLTHCHEKDARWHIIRLRRNYGQTAALQAGIDAASGEVIVTLDADLENNPHNIPDLLDRLAEGFDIVSGWRVERWKGGIFSRLKRKVPSTLANYLISRLSGVALHDTGCTLKAYRAEVLKELRLYGDMHRFIPALASQMGARVTEVPVEFQPRRFGSSKYGFSRTLKVFLDIILLRFWLVFLTKPMQFFGLLGVMFCGVGSLCGLYLTLLKLVGHQDIGTRPLLLFSVLLLMVGVQFFMFGILGEISVRTYFESQQKRTYYIREHLG